MTEKSDAIEELMAKQHDIQKQILAAQNRVQVPPTNVPPAVVVEAPNNPLIARVQLPGSTFQLPSRGLFYTDGELSPDVEMGEVHVHAMAAFDEILMKSPDSLFSGAAVDKVFKRCIPQILKPTKLLAKDVDFLLICLRQITYGNDIKINYNHGCSEEASKQEYMGSMSGFLEHTRRIDPTTIGSLYTTTLDNGQVIKLKPTTFEDLIKMYQDTDPSKSLTPEEELELGIFAIGSVIVAVDEISNQEQIKEWIKSIPAGWIKVLSNVIEKTSDFGTELKLDTTCKDCGEEITIETPINPVSFFL